MARREQLQSRLEQILGSENVYFSPPPNVKMEYPAIVYRRDGANTRHADNKVHKHQLRYLVTVISRIPDAEVLEKLFNHPLCRYDRCFTANNLVHDVFEIYF